MKRLVTGLVGMFAAPLFAQTAPPAAAPVATSPAVTPLEGGPSFISPMGEPFHSPDTLSGAEHWFRQADANHDGKITPDEMKADADRFFATLDTDHDGMIGPDELDHYETDVAPEIRVASTMGNMELAKSDDDGNVTPPPYPTRLGAGRFGYLDMPEPVVSADANMDRAVSRQEFEYAALKRLRMLDTDGAGALTRSELPKLSVRVRGEDVDGTPHQHRGGGRGHHGGGGGFGGGAGGPGGL